MLWPFLQVQGHYKKIRSITIQKRKYGTWVLIFSLKGQESNYHNLEEERYWLDLSTYICTISSKNSHLTDTKLRKLVKRSKTALLNSNSQAQSQL